MSPAASIHLLSRQLANQIAAGEVVERPASILKELLENSLDAGARQIDIDVEQGGIKRIAIRDDGHGIAADELVLAVSRHATSKIHSLDDLESIVSMGFRGEALASISSVSHLQLTSRQADSEQAWQLQISDADLTPGKPIPAAHPPGTSVETRDLFYNIPARRKFLRSERTEYRHLEDVVRRVALARFDVGFRFRHNQRELFNLPIAADQSAQERRLARLCGKAFVQQVQHLDAASSGPPQLQLSGWVLPPEAARSQADLQYFFVNGRIIRDRLVNHALRQAYAERIFPGRHPAWVLYLQLDPQQVDVNVHPTKHEVRFREARQVHDFLCHSLMQVFASASDSGAGADKLAASSRWLKPAEGNVVLETGSPVYRQAVSPRSSAPPSQQSRAGYERLRTLAASRVSPSVAETLPATALDNEAPIGRSLAMVGDCLVVEGENTLLLVDIPAARACLLKQHLQRYLDDDAVSQPLLFPLLLQLDEQQRRGLQQQEALLKILGFEWTQPDLDSLQLRAVPAVLRELDFQQWLPALLTSFAADKVDDPLAILTHQAINSMASGSQSEAEDVLAQLWASQISVAGIWRELNADELLGLIDAG
ncbi:DNA mismatch repair protein MutL [hydrothermal vent metagenome]|uniref:DNA mismatch repair protein MutL n=1 Tax=hydrothermal vent metagenome TaxID=652676 RepID=A0A3B1BNW6_9ZZZZ